MAARLPSVFLRALALGVVVVAAAARPAEAGRAAFVVVNTGDDIQELGRVPTHVSEVTGYGTYGYHYQRFGLFWMDLWRWDGELVLYADRMYVPLTDAEAAELGLPTSVPWTYHLPPGLLLVLAAVELALVGRKRRSARFALGMGVGLLGFSAVFLWQGGGASVVIPAFLGLYHLAATFFTPAGAQPDKPDHEHHELDEDDDDGDEEPGRLPRPVLDPPPRVEVDPFRAPPQQPPIVVARPSQPAVVPMAADANAADPKLLR